MAYPRTIEDQEPWWLMQAMNPPASLPCCPGISMLGAEKRKNQTLLKKERESYRNVIKYFQEITEYIVMWRHTLTISMTSHRERRWMDGERRRIESSKVSQECYVQASRPGLDQGLCRHHRAQVEGVEGPMGDVPQVVERSGGVPAPRTRLQHLVDSEQAVPYPRAGRHVILTSEARRRQWSRQPPRRAGDCERSRRDR